jgi:hypothetical protein
VGLEKREYVKAPGSPSSYGHVVERSTGVLTSYRTVEIVADSR